MGTSLGLDIGARTIRVVELEKTREGISLKKAASVEVPIELEEVSSPIDRVQRIAELITRLLAREDIRPGPCVVALPGQSVFIRFIEILEVSKEKVAQTIKYEAQQQIPFSLDEVDWDYQLLPKARAMGREAVLAAVKKDLVNENMEIIKRAKLSSTIMDVSPLALYNSLRFNADYDESKLTVLIDIGAKATNLIILNGDELWVRSFPLAGNKLTEALQNRFNLSFAEAERLKKSELITREEYKEALSPVLKDLLVEIERSVECYRFESRKVKGGGPKETTPSSGGTPQATEGEEAKSQNVNPVRDKTPEASAPPKAEISNGVKRQRIEEILLCGGSCELEGLDRFLGDRLSASVRIIDPFKKLITRRATERPSAPHQFGVAVGSALRQLERLKVEVNFLKEMIRRKQELRQSLLYRGLSIGVAILLIGISYSFVTKDYNLKEAQLEKLKGRIEVCRTYAPKTESLTSANEALAGRVEALYRLARDRGLWLEVIVEIARVLPKEVWITDLASTMTLEESLRSGSFDMSGKAISHKAVNEFVSSLKSLKFFQNVKPLSLVEKGEPEKGEKIIEFTVTMDVGIYEGE